MKEIEVLKTSGVISQDIYESIGNIEFILDQFPIMNDEEKSVFLVHVAMASLRVQKHEEIPCIGEDIRNSLKELEVYELACILLTKVEKYLCVPFPDTERDYLLLHICNGYRNYANCNYTK